MAVTVAIVANHLFLPLILFGSVIFHRRKCKGNKNENAVSLYHINDKLAYAMCTQKASLINIIYDLKGKNET